MTRGGVRNVTLLRAIYAQLGTTPQRNADLAAAVGARPDNVGRALKRLAELHLAERRPDKLWVASTLARLLLRGDDYQAKRFSSLLPGLSESKYEAISLVAGRQFRLTQTPPRDAWFDAYAQVDHNVRMPKRIAWRDWRDWCRRSGVKFGTPRAFTEYLAGRGVVATDDVYEGLCLPFLFSGVVESGEWCAWNGVKAERANAHKIKEKMGWDDIPARTVTLALRAARSGYLTYGRDKTSRWFKGEYVV